MFYIITTIGLLVALYVGYLLTLRMDKKVSKE